MSHGRHGWRRRAARTATRARSGPWAPARDARARKVTGACASQLFERGLAAVGTFSSPRAWAFTLLGIHEYLRRFPDDPRTRAMREALTGKLVTLWKSCATEDWPWFEPSATYDNARLCQALILSGQWMPNGEALEIGLKSLRWLASIQKTQAGHFRPIGSNGFYQRDGARADFDQQPVEAQAMVAACLEAFRATHDPSWSREAQRAFEWFLGRNDLGLPLYDSSTGGCSDGLHIDRVNENQGAESSLAFHLSLAEMNCAEHSGSPPGRRPPHEPGPPVPTRGARCLRRARASSSARSCPAAPSDHHHDRARPGHHRG